MTTGLVIHNFVEMVEFIRPFRQNFLHFEELVNFYDDIDSDCNCNKMSKINRCINYYCRYSSILTQEEINKILTENNKNPVILMYQNSIFMEITKSSYSVTS